MNNDANEAQEDPLKDLPSEPPSFARPMETLPDADGMAVVWDEEYGCTGGTVAAQIETYDQSPTPVFRDLSGKGWLPFDHCRIDGEPPEAVPEKGDHIYWYDLKSDVEDYSKITSTVDAHPEYVACWDYTAESETDDSDTPTRAELAEEVRDLQERVCLLEKGIGTLSIDADDGISSNEAAIAEIREAVGSHLGRTEKLEDRVKALENADPSPFALQAAKGIQNEPDEAADAEPDDGTHDRRPPSETPEDGSLIEVVTRRPDIPGPTLGRYQTKQDILGYDTEGVVRLPGVDVNWSSARIRCWRYSSLEERVRALESNDAARPARLQPEEGGRE